MKINQELISKYQWQILGVVCLLAIFFFIYLSWPEKPIPIDTQQIINNTKAELTKQYEKHLATKDTEIKDAKAKLYVSESKYKVIVEKYETLKKERENVKPPQTNQELRDRFSTLGYPPLPIK